MIPVNDQSTSQTVGKNLSVAYASAVDNSSHTLADGASLTGTLTLKAGYQLVFVCRRSIYSSLTLSFMSAYVEDEFEDYDTLTLSSSNTNFGSTYRTITYYADDGSTTITAKAGSSHKFITDDLGAGSYDVYYRLHGDASVSNMLVESIFFGAVESVSSDASHYAVGLDQYIIPNMWYHATMGVSASGMTIVGDCNYFPSGSSVDIRVKEVA